MWSPGIHCPPCKTLDPLELLKLWDTLHCFATLDHLERLDVFGPKEWSDLLGSMQPLDPQEHCDSLEGRGPLCFLSAWEIWESWIAWKRLSFIEFMGFVRISCAVWTLWTPALFGTSWTLLSPCTPWALWTPWILGWAGLGWARRGAEPRCMRLVSYEGKKAFHRKCCLGSTFLLQQDLDSVYYLLPRGVHCIVEAT